VDDGVCQQASTPQRSLANFRLSQHKREGFSPPSGIDKCSPGPETNVVTTRDKRLFVGGRRATNIPEQGRVVHVRGGAIVKAEPPRKSGSDEASSHCGFGRVAHAQIGDE
jgi:hypothetical protein